MYRLIANLRMWKKFALIGVLALGMLAIPTTLVIKANLKSVHTAQTEKAGIGPAGAMLTLIQLTQQHRGLSAGFLAGNAKLGETRLSRQGELNQTLGNMLASVLFSKLGDASLIKQLEEINTTWQALATAVSSQSISGAESFQRHTALITNQMHLLERVVEVSGLAYDTDVASYHLIRAVLGDLPQLTEYLGQARAVGSTLLTKKAATSDDKAQVNMLASLAEYRLQSSSSAFGKAGVANANLQESMAQPLMAALLGAGTGLALLNDNIVRAQELDFSPVDYFSGMTTAIDAQFALITVGFNALEEILTQRADETQHALWLVSGVMAGIFMVALWLAMVVIRSIVRSIGRSLLIAQSVARGDLTSAIEVRGTDEVGQLLRALDDMNSSLTHIVTQVRSGTDSIATASSQIAAGNTDLSSRTVAQASSLEETAASMEQLISTVTQNSDNAQLANELARSASEVAIRGGQVVNQVADTMAAINESSKKVADIIGIIDSIAFQTNILALNAAVEAARSGEQGRGFAVVAAEVRNLAQRSAAASQEIKALIDASVSQVSDGSQLASVAGQTMGEIVSSIGRVTDIMGEISVASQEQTLGIEQINQAVSQMDGVTQQNAALVEEAAAAAHSLQEQADNLVASVSVFKLA